jgi:hypothetical protein
MTPWKIWIGQSTTVNQGDYTLGKERTKATIQIWYKSL